MTLRLPETHEWLTPAEAAAEALPGFAHSERHIRRLVETGDIASRPRGGGRGRSAREFHWSLLPETARAEYLRRHGCAASGAALPAPARETAKDLEAQARLLILAAFQDFADLHRGGVGGALKVFSAAFQARRVAIDNWVFNVIPAVTPATLRAWDRRLRDGGSAALADRRGRPKGTGAIEGDAALRNFIAAKLVEHTRITAVQLQQLIAVHLGRQIKLRTLQAFLSSFKTENRAVLKAMANPDQYRSHHKPAFGRADAGIARINQLWQLDATRADAMCIAGDGSERRLSLTAVIDVYTRRACVVVSDQPRASATMATLRRAILAWGLPETIKSDNGKEFFNHAVMRFCADLGIALQFSRPFTPEEKPFVERFFGTLNSSLFPLLPGYVGANIVQRKAIESRRSFQHRFGIEARITFETSLAPAALQGRIDAWLREVYEHSLHRGLKARPAEIAAAAAGDVRRLENERALDMLLLEAPGEHGLRVAGKKGIALGGRFYVADELGDRMGKRVSIRFDPHEPRFVYVYEPEGAFICIAEDAALMDNVRLIGVARAAQARDRRRQARIRGDAAQVIKLHPKANDADALITAAAARNALFDLRADAAEAMRAASPPRMIAHAAAQDGAAAIGAEPAPVTAEQRAAAEAVLAELNAPVVAARMEQCDGYERPCFAGDDLGFWRWAVAFRAEGGQLDAQDKALIAHLALDRIFQEQLAIDDARQRALAKGE